MMTGAAGARGGELSRATTAATDVTVNTVHRLAFGQLTTGRGAPPFEQSAVSEVTGGDGARIGGAREDAFMSEVGGVPEAWRELTTMHNYGRPPTASGANVVGGGGIALDLTGRPIDAQEPPAYYGLHYPSAGSALSSAGFDGGGETPMAVAFRERAGILRRLAPEALHAAGLGEKDIFRLYRALRVYSLGFHEVLHQVTSRVAGSEASRELKAAIRDDARRFFARLWDGGCGTMFESEVVALAEARDTNAAAAADLRARLEHSRKEENELQLALDRMVNEQLKGVEGTKRREADAEATRETLRKTRADLELMKRKLAQTVSEKENQEEKTAMVNDDLTQTRVAYANKAKEAGKLHVALRNAQTEAKETNAQMDVMRENLRGVEAEVEAGKAREAAAEEARTKAEALRSAAEANLATMTEESLRIKMRCSLLDADVEYKRTVIADLERTIKEKEVAERHAKLVKAQMILEAQALKGKVDAQKKRAEALEEKLAAEKAARAEDKRVADRHIADLKTEIATEREARRIINEQLEAVKKKLEYKRMKKRYHKKKRLEAEEEVKRLEAIVKHRDAAVLAFTAEAWRLRAVTANHKRAREDAESRAKNADELMRASENARAKAQAASEAAIADATKARASEKKTAEEAAAAAATHASEKKSYMTQLMDLEQARENLLADLARLRKKHEEQGSALAATTSERDAARDRIAELETELENLKALLEAERKKWAEDMEGALAKARAELEAKARANAWSARTKSAAAMRKKEEEDELERERLNEEIAFTKEMFEDMMKAAKKRQAELEAEIEELKAAIMSLENDGGDLRGRNEALTENLRATQKELDQAQATIMELTKKSDKLQIECDERASKMRHLAHLLAKQRDSVVAADEAVAVMAKQMKTSAGVGDFAADYDWAATRASRANAEGLDDGAVDGGEGQFASVAGEDEVKADEVLTQADEALEFIKRGFARVPAPLQDATAAAKLLAEDYDRLKAAKAKADADIARLEATLEETRSSGQKGAAEYMALSAKLSDTQVALAKAVGALDRYDVVAGNVENALAAQEEKEQAILATTEAALARLAEACDGSSSHPTDASPEDSVQLGDGYFGKVGAAVDGFYDVSADIVRTNRANASGGAASMRVLQGKLDAALTELDKWRKMIAALEARIPPLEEEIARLNALVQEKDAEVEAAKIAAVEAAEAAAEAVRKEMFPMLETANEDRDNARKERDDALAAKAECCRIEQEAIAARDKAIEEMLEAQRLMREALEMVAKAQVEMEDAKAALAKHLRNKDRPSLEGLWTRHARRGPGNKPIHVPMSREVARVTIFNLYIEKIAADIADDRDEQSTRQTLPEFTYDWFLFKYGLQEFAEMHLAGLLRSMEDNLSDPRIALFASLCGLAKCEEEYPLDCTHFMMMFLSHLLKVTDGPEVSEAESGHSSVRLKMAVETCQSLMLEDWGEEALKKVERDMDKVKNPEDRSNPMIDIDMVLSCVSGAWMERYHSQMADLKALFLSADENGDGVLSQEEFQVLLKSDGMSWLPARQAKGMFRECLQESMHGSRISPEGFISVAFKHGLKPVMKKWYEHAPLRLGVLSPFGGAEMLAESWAFNVGDLDCDVEDFKKSDHTVKDDVNDIVSWMTEIKVLIKSKTSVEAAWQLYRRIMMGVKTQLHRMEMAKLEEKAKNDGAKAFDTKFKS